MAELGYLTVIPNIVGSVVAAWLAYRVYQGRPTSYRTSLFMTFFLISATSLILAGERLIFDLEYSLMLIVVEYTTETILLLCILVFVMQYTGHGGWVTPRNLALIAAPGASCVILNLTNPWHGLIYTNAVLVVQGGVAIVDTEYGPLFLLWVANFISITVACLGLLYATLPDSSFDRRMTTWSLMLALGIMTISIVAYLLLPRNSAYVDFLSIGLTLSAITIFFGERGFSSADAELVTAREAIKGMEDAVLVFNANMALVFVNEHGQRIVDENREFLIERSAARGLSVPMGSNKWEIALKVNGVPQHYSVSTSDIVREGKAIGAVVVFHDISKRKEMEDSINRANRSLRTLNQIIRHDIKNDLTAIGGYLELMEGTNLDPRQRELLLKTKDLARSVDGHLTFAKDHQTIGSDPAWQDLQGTFDDTLSKMDLGGIGYDSHIQGIKVLADPMFPNVVHCLADNTVRHGKKATKIIVKTEETEVGLLIIWEDDGVGVPLADKEKIFVKGFGQNTGLGLFLVQEILSSTGACISEEGEPGKGARFVVLVPSGWYIRTSPAGT
ncbi:MAG: ATP-binding protein [Methanomassiliicoccales archaeon]|nr:ATP-binding protein [Methanomassiliicoccales archaeon]